MKPPEPLRVAVFGVGAVGGYFGGRLAGAGHDVTFVARGEGLTALETNGLRVDSIGGDFVVRPARATDDPATVGPVDLVVLGVKAWQVPAAAERLRPLVGDADSFAADQVDWDGVATEEMVRRDSLAKPDRLPNWSQPYFLSWVDPVTTRPVYRHHGAGHRDRRLRVLDAQDQARQRPDRQILWRPAGELDRARYFVTHVTPTLKRQTAAV